MSLSLRPLMSTSVLAVAKAPNPLTSTLVSCAVDAAIQGRQLHAGGLRDDFLHGLRRRVRDIVGGDHGRRCADDAGELPVGRCTARSMVRSPARRSGCRFARRSARRGASRTLRRLIGLARVRVSSTGGLTSIGGSWSGEPAGRLGGGNTQRENGQRENSRQAERCDAAYAALVREDMVGPRYDVSGTSQRTKSHHGASAPLVKLMSVLPDRHLRV